MHHEQVSIDWHRELVDQLEFYWTHLRRRLDGLSDAEYLWEPVPGWSVRTAPGGAARIDREEPEPDPPPFTTIAWRLCHMAGDVLGNRAARHLGDDRYANDAVTPPLTATEGLAWLDGAHTAWIDGIRSLSTDDLHRRALTRDVAYHGPSMASLVLHINREIVHHGAEICCLRDLYRDLHGTT